jgi:hypothetical protein
LESEGAPLCMFEFKGAIYLKRALEKRVRGNILFFFNDVD